MNQRRKTTPRKEQGFALVSHDIFPLSNVSGLCLPTVFLMFKSFSHVNNRSLLPRSFSHKDGWKTKFLSFLGFGNFSETMPNFRLTFRAKKTFAPPIFCRSKKLSLFRSFVKGSPGWNKTTKITRWIMGTLLETNIAPARKPSQKEMHLPTTNFQVLC